MSKGSGLTNRSVVNHGVNGKGDASRVTDERTYRKNFDEIDWRVRRTPPAQRSITNEEHEWRMGLCL